MISRRSLLVTGATTAVVAGGLGVLGLAHRLDDVLDAVGIDPRPEPDARDQRLLTKVAAAQNAVLATVEATAARHTGLALAPLVAISREHLKAVGGATTVPDVAAVPADAAAATKALSAAYASAARARAGDAGRAVSPDLVRVLASMSAGLTQCAQQAKALR